MKIVPHLATKEADRPKQNNKESKGRQVAYKGMVMLLHF